SGCLPRAYPWASNLASKSTKIAFQASATTDVQGAAVETTAKFKNSVEITLDDIKFVFLEEFDQGLLCRLDHDRRGIEYQDVHRNPVPNVTGGGWPCADRRHRVDQLPVVRLEELRHTILERALWIDHRQSGAQRHQRGVDVLRIPVLELHLMYAVTVAQIALQPVDTELVANHVRLPEDV